MMRKNCGYHFLLISIKESFKDMSVSKAGCPQRTVSWEVFFYPLLFWEMIYRLQCKSNRVLADLSHLFHKRSGVRQVRSAVNV